MGTSSTFGASNTHVKYNITINQNSQNVSNNCSNVTVYVRFWRENTVREILRNEKYTGNLLLQKTFIVITLAKSNAKTKVNCQCTM